MRSTRLIRVLCSTIVLGLFWSTASAGLGDLIKQGKKAAEELKKAEEKLKEDASKPDDAKPTDAKTPDAKPAEVKTGPGTIVFSAAPIDPAKPAGLTNVFKAGDRIYSLVTFTDTIANVANGGRKAKTMIEVKCWLDGTYYGRGSANLIFRNKAVEAKTLLLDIAPDADKMTAYTDKDIEYPKKYEIEGKRAGPMQLTKMLSGLSAGKHTVKLEFYHYKTLAEGTFMIDGDFAPYAALFKELDEATTATAPMPVAKMKDEKLEAAMTAALKSSSVKEARDGKILKVYIIDDDWYLERHKLSGLVLFRYIRTQVALTDPDGQSWLWKFVFKQDYLGNTFQKTKLHGIQDRVKILAKNVK